MIIFITVLTYLIFCTYTDISSMKINIPLSVFFCIGGIILSLLPATDYRSILQIAAGICPGILLMLLSYITRGAIGLGDGIMLVTIGCFFPFSYSICFLFYGLLIAAITSLVLLVSGKRSQKFKLPFAPFLLFGYITCHALFYFLA